MGSEFYRTRKKVGIEQPLMEFVKVKSQLFGTVIT